MEIDKEKRELGFTLLELLVGMIIIGTLAAIAVPMFRQHQKTAVEATLVSDVREAAYQMEQDAIMSSTGEYPTAIASTYHHSANNNIVLVEDQYSDITGFCIIGRNNDYTDLYVYYDSTDRAVTTTHAKTGDCGTGETYPDGVEAGSRPPDTAPTTQAPTPTSAPTAVTVVPTTPAANPTASASPTTSAPPTQAQPETQPPAPVGYADAKRKKYNVCHGPNMLSLPLSGIQNGHDGHSNDIIPPIPSGYPKGKNWTQAGATTWYNNCSGHFH
jgi:prepilin-type N-terminal cleavage/methylation domain-containing protein